METPTSQRNRRVSSAAAGLQFPRRGSRSLNTHARASFVLLLPRCSRAAELADTCCSKTPSRHNTTRRRVCASVDSRGSHERTPYSPPPPRHNTNTRRDGSTTFPGDLFHRLHIWVCVLLKTHFSLVLSTNNNTSLTLPPGCLTCRFITTQAPRLCATGTRTSADARRPTLIYRV